MPEHTRITRQGDEFYCLACEKRWDVDDPDPPGCVGPVVHTTVGVYPDGTIRINGVAAGNLESHIEYNKRFRPGRALFVDGKCVHCGYLGIQRCADLLPKIKSYKRKTDSAPYR